MIGNLRPASDAEIEQLLANPADVTRFLYGAQAANAECVSLHKAWHAIHFALTGSRLGGPEPLNFLLDEGIAVGAVDVGYGPARVLSSHRVHALAAALDPLTPEVVGQRVDLARLDQEVIYPGNWQSNGIGAEYVVANYVELRRLIVRLAREGLGLVLFVN